MFKKAIKQISITAAVLLGLVGFAIAQTPTNNATRAWVTSNFCILTGCTITGQTQISSASVAGGRYTSGAITATAVFGGSTVTLSGVSQLNVGPGMVISGTGVTSGTKIVSFQSGTSGGDGVYAITPSQTLTSRSVTIQGWADLSVIGKLGVSTTASAGEFYDTGTLNLYDDTSAGAQLVLRGSYGAGPATNAYLQFSNNASDQDMVMALNNDQQTAFSNTRGGYIAMNYGHFGIWTNYQTASPRNWFWVNGVRAGAGEGYIGLGGNTSPQYMLDVAGNINISSGNFYRVNGAQISASNLSNGVSGSGAIALVGSPTFTGTVNAAALTLSSTFTPASSVNFGNVTQTGTAAFSVCATNTGIVFIKSAANCF